MACQKRAVLSLLTSALLVSSTLPMLGASGTKDEETIRNASMVLQAMVASNGLPASVLAKADCIIVLPGVKKFAVGIGGSGGRGPMTCRRGPNFSANWAPPAMYSIGGASAGFQVGGTATDYVLVILSPGAVDKVLNGSVKIGNEVTADRWTRCFRGECCRRGRHFDLLQDIGPFRRRVSERSQPVSRL